ncbi:hypothetical protein PMAYCL1PPCAC_18051, partial [Pristionchus mayeri]
MILFLFFISAIVYVFLYYQHVRKYPKGPLPLPLIGNLYHLNPDGLHEYLHETGKEYGHCFTLFLPRPVVVFTDFTTIREALVTQGENFAGRSHLPPETYLQKIAQTGVLISDGDVWREQRRTSLRIMRELGLGKNLMEAQVNRSIDEMIDQLKGTNDGVNPFDMNTPIQLCVGNIINETLFGFHFKYSDTTRFQFFLDCVNKHLQNIRDNFWVMIIQAWPWMRHLHILGEKGYKEPVRNISKYQSFIEEEVNGIVKTYDSDHEPTNFVQSYLSEMKKNKELDITNLYAIVVDFWLAGMETTSTTLRWALLFLMKYPHVQDKMRSELISVVGRERRIEMADKPNLPYFNAAIAEIQRAANMIPFLGFHRCTEDSMIGNHFIPKDTLTMPQIYSGLKDDEIFEKPAEFLPERFLEKDGKTANKKQLERLIAFGLGKRQCVGEGLARMELFLVLGTLLLNYRFEPTESIDMRPLLSAVLVPRFIKQRKNFTEIIDKLRIGKDSFEATKNLHYMWHIHSVKALLVQVSKGIVPLLDK